MSPLLLTKENKPNSWSTVGSLTISSDRIIFDLVDSLILSAYYIATLSFRVFSRDYSQSKFSVIGGKTFCSFIKTPSLKKGLI